MGQIGIGQQLFAHFLPALDLVDAATGIFVQGDIEPIDQLGVRRFNVEGIVLRVVLAGFGIGFERFMMFITGMQNIRDVLPYARTPRALDF